MNRLNEQPPQFQRRIVMRGAEIDSLGGIRLESAIRWFEETEYAFLRSRGLSVSMRDERGQFGFPRLTTEIEIHQTIDPFSELEISLWLVTSSLKQLEYRFQAILLKANDEVTVVATGGYFAACCRFPPSGLPYPILIPDWVLYKLGIAPL